MKPCAPRASSAWGISRRQPSTSRREGREAKKPYFVGFWEQMVEAWVFARRARARDAWPERIVAPGVVREKIVVVVPIKSITLSDAARVQGGPGGGFSHGPTLAVL